MGTLIFPYRTFSGKLKMTLNTVSVQSLRDGLVEDVPLTGDEWNRAQRSLLLWKRDDIEWNTAHFEIEVVAPLREIKKLAKDSGDLVIAVSAQCVATNLRQACTASPSSFDASIWT
jgi:hypothetical protein